MNAIAEIVCYAGLLPFEPTEPNVDACMKGMARAGVTHVQINHLPDLLHPEQLNQPENVYLWFANFAPPLDLFVSSKLNAGLYPELYLERNRRTLLRFAGSARRQGIKPLLYLCEPRFVPERFFQKHPTLRGPRVDNPVCSKTPLFALCTDLPEVREHYREMMAKMMDLVPDLALASLFTSDSGAGFDYNPDSYAGANGAAFNRGIPLERRVARFLTVLLEEGRQRNPEFTVHLTSGFSPENRAKILAIAPKGIVGSVYGLYDWEGGLEEHWGYHQAVWGVPKAKWNVRTLDRAAAAADRLADMRQRFAIAAAGGREPIVHAEIPTTDYPRPLRYVPHPFETIRLMKEIAGLGARKISAWGVMNPPELVAHDVNAEVMRAINANIKADADAVVRGIAEQWVGPKHAPALVQAWKICDRAWTHRPMWVHGGLPKQGLPGPLVPDLVALRPEEVAYYKTVALADLELIQGVGAWLAHEADERNRDHVLHELYEKDTLPKLQEAVALLEKEAATAAAEPRAILLGQRDYIQVGYLYQRSHYNWYEASRYLVPGKDPGQGRTLTAIIDDELQVTKDLIAALDGRLAQFVRMYPSNYMTYEIGPGLVEQLRARLQVMQAHRNDPPRPLTERLGKMRAYLESMMSSET